MELSSFGIWKQGFAMLLFQITEIGLGVLLSGVQGAVQGLAGKARSLILPTVRRIQLIR
jgi:hypothetical protein